MYSCNLYKIKYVDTLEFNHTYLAAGSSYAISFRYMNNGSTAGAAAERGQLELRCTYYQSKGCMMYCQLFYQHQLTSSLVPRDLSFVMYTPYLNNAAVSTIRL